MGCPEYETIERYASGALKGRDAADFEDHLKDCRDCAARVLQARENEKLLAELRTYHADVEGACGGKRSFIETPERAQQLLGKRYRVIRKVGEGSAGEVFQAIDTVLERLVAIKFLRPKEGGDESARQIWHEARMMSRMNHPNIAQIYEIGELEDQRFIVMEWVDGLPVTDAWKGLQVQQRLRIFLGILEAVGAAHRRGIIHRDIKPSNILVTAELKAKVLDFGIALEQSSLADIEKGPYRGTPAYSAPEQITAPAKIGPATDVFALGVLLYELLTDTLPFSQTDVRELFRAIRSEHPELPAAIAAKTPIPLQNICLKALEKEPQNRYPDALSLSDDINRYLRGEKVWSRPSFLADKIQQEVFYHGQKLKAWHKDGLLTEKELDRLEGTYRRMISPGDPSIIEARKLSLSQVCLYFGGWVVVLGSFVLFYKTWNRVPLYARPMPAIIAAGLMTAIGIVMWRRRESRLAMGFLATANLLIPITILLTLAQWEVLSAARYPWGKEIAYQGLHGASYLMTGNVQLFISTACWLLLSLVFLRVTRSSIFVVFSIVSFLALLTTCYKIAGLQDWKQDVIAGRYLYPGVALFIMGAIADRRGLLKYAWPLCAVGLALIVVPLSVIALSENTLFGWLHGKVGFLSQVEHRLLSFTCNGIIYLVLAGLCRLLGTPLQRLLAQVLNWLGSLHVLVALRMLDSKEYELPNSRLLIYRFMLPVASVGFVFGSVARQMKSFFFSGLAGVAVAVHRFTVEHLDKFFAWPVSLISAGIIWMLVSWLVPRWQAKRRLRPKGQRASGA